MLSYFSDENKPFPLAWLHDLECCCSLLIGCCLGDMLQGSPITEQEKAMGSWMENRIFSNGLRSIEHGNSNLFASGNFYHLLITLANS